MRAKAAATELLDPYRAGLELAEQLVSLAPEVVLLFSSIHVATSLDFLQAIHDVLGDKPLVIGASGDGVFHLGRALRAGSSALGLNSDGAVEWKLISVPGVVARPAGVMREALDAARQWAGIGGASLMFMFADFRADANELENVLADAACCPVVGGLSGDDYRLHDGVLFANHNALRGHLVLLVAKGRLDYSLSLGHHLERVGEAGVVEVAQGRHLMRVAGRSAQQFVADQLGRNQINYETTTLAVLEKNSDRVLRLRAVVPGQLMEDGLELYAGVPEGYRVQVCRAHASQLADEAEAIARRLADKSPVAALLISCAGREFVLGQQLDREVQGLRKVFPSLPLAGYPAFGEIAPVPLEEGGYSGSYFHNMTYVLLLLMP